MIVVSLIAWVLAACANAVMDTLAHHYDGSIFYRTDKGPKWHDFWNPEYSWKNKYKDNDKWYGWINDTILIWITDGWHLFQMIMKTAVIIAIVSHETIVTWYWDILIYTVIWGLIFEVFYKYLLVRK